MLNSTSIPATRVLIVGTSLNPDSKSWIMARTAGDALRARGVEVELLDLRDVTLPFAGSVYTDDQYPDLARVKAAFKRATHLTLAVPIYNGDVNAAARNLPNLGCAFTDKAVGFLCAAGGDRSYMGVMSFGNSLMFEFESWIVPRYVYAVTTDFANGAISNPEITRRIERMLTALLSHPATPKPVLQPVA